MNLCKLLYRPGFKLYHSVIIFSCLDCQKSNIYVLFIMTWLLCLSASNDPIFGHGNNFMNAITHVHPCLHACLPIFVCKQIHRSFLNVLNRKS
jgi:hypothetical protein